MEIAFKKSVIGSLLMIVALSLILSFVLHDIIPHEHPKEIFGTGIQAVFHGEDRKWWFLLLLTSLFLAFGSLTKDEHVHSQRSLARGSFWLTFDFSKIFDPIREALRTGILNPKLCD